MRALHSTVVAGGVVYPAGTAATEELEELIPEKHWIDGYGQASPGGASAEQISELRQLAAHEIETRDARITELETEVERLTAELELATAPPADPDPVPGPAPDPAPDPVDYLSKTGAELKELIDARNFDRDPGEEGYIRVDPPGNKPQLAAALEADDNRTDS